jgi:hypothetical protein
VVASLYALLPAPLLAQVADRQDARSDGQHARNDAHLATPNLATPEPLSNLYSIAPGLEQQAAAEAALDAAPANARHRSSRIFELRAARDLARLWADRGQPRKAHNLLAPIYSWFAEGFNTADLKDAKAHLEELA